MKGENGWAKGWHDRAGEDGLALSRALIVDGHEVWGYDTDPARMGLPEEAGGHPTASAREVAGVIEVYEGKDRG